MRGYEKETSHDDTKLPFHFTPWIRTILFRKAISRRGDSSRISCYSWDDYLVWKSLSLFRSYSDLVLEHL